ncbi:MAG: hypothetical protein LBI19_02465, partial [Oscillospiraceae bacterium]|nr:hypothetical protein [Oscillospiraceae bacterium]
MLAFAVMTVSSCFIMGRTLNNKLLKNADDVISGTQSHLYHLLLEPEAVINMIADSIQDHIRSGDSFEAIQAHMIEYSSPSFKEKMRMFEYISIYAFFDVYDAFFDGGGWDPSDDYLPRERPWYTAAIQSGGRVAISEPYIDLDTGKPVVSFARRMSVDAGELLGVIAIDVPLEFIGDMINERKITEGSFGILVDETLRVIVHPDNTQIGINIVGSDLPLEQFSDLIQEGLPISRLAGVNYRGENSLYFGRQLNNGWYISVVVPQSEYYAELYQMILIIGILGALLAAILVFMLLRLEKAKRKSDEESRQKSAKLTEMEKQRAADELTQLMLDATPLAFSLWTSDLKNIATNEETVRMFNLTSKEEYLERFNELSPPLQPCGTPSAEKVRHYVQKAFDEGYCRFDWIHQTISGEPIQAETTLVRVKRGDGYVVAGYTRDLREHKKMLDAIERRDELLHMVNHAAGIILTTADNDSFIDSLLASFQLIGQSMDVDRVQIWENETLDGELYFVNKYEWLSEVGKQKKPVPNGFDFSYSVMPEWHKFFL